MHNQHISGILQGEPTASGIENSSSIFQNCIESKLKGIKVVVTFLKKVLAYKNTKEKFDKRMLAVKSRLREKKHYYY